LFHADGWMDGWTDMMKILVAFCNFANVPNKMYFVVTAFITVINIMSQFHRC
jgi:uncharacterized membrane protein